MRSWIWKGLTAYVQLLVFFLGAQAGDGFWEIPDENGAQCGNMAATWKGRCASDLYGRCLDLKHAYKQLGRNPVDNWSSVLAVDLFTFSKLWRFQLER